MSEPTHADMVAAVAHWRDNGKRLIWREVAVGSVWLDAHIPIPDVYTVDKSYNPNPIAYECKASRSDFLSDLRSRKWAKYMPISTRLYFATPHGMVGREEVPDECGLVTWEPEADKWRTVVRAPVRKASLTQHQWLGLLFAMQEQRVRVRDCAEREVVIRNRGLLPERHQLAADVQAKLRSLDDELVMMRLANERIKSIEEQTRRAHAEASRALRTAQSQDAQTIIDHLGKAVWALRSTSPTAVEDFLRRHVVGYQETGESKNG